MCRLHTLPSGWMVEGEYIHCLLRFCPVQSLLFYFILIFFIHYPFYILQHFLLCLQLV